MKKIIPFGVGIVAAIVLIVFEVTYDKTARNSIEQIPLFVEEGILAKNDYGCITTVVNDIVIPDAELHNIDNDTEQETTEEEQILTEQDHGTTTKPGKTSDITEPSESAGASSTPNTTQTTPSTSTVTPVVEVTTTETPSTVIPVQTTTECQHNWVAQTTSINHPEEGEYREVMTMGGYYNPITVLGTQCNVCMKDDIYNVGSTGDGGWRCPYCGVSGSYGSVTYEIGQEYVEPIYRTKWVVTKEAWTETITTYTCSICGATK